jgi:hypothetical protein
MAAEDELPPQQPILEDASPTPAAGESGPDERSAEEQGGTDDEELLIAAIVAHRRPTAKWPV